MAVLRESHVPISVLPERLVAEALEEEGVALDELRPGREGDVVVLNRPEIADRVFGNAITRWWATLPIWKRIAFEMQHQLQTQWCWAATSVSVSRYYSPLSSWTQCSMVNAERGQATCCTDGSSAACNQPNVLDSPLQRARVLDHMQGGDVTYDVIQDEIDGGRPLCWRIGWSGGGGHFAVIEGYRVLGEAWVAVDDPWYGASDVPLSTLTGGAYKGSGDWTHTYFTRKPALVFPKVDERVRLHPKIWDRLKTIEQPVVAGRGGERS